MKQWTIRQDNVNWSTIECRETFKRKEIGCQMAFSNDMPVGTFLKCLEHQMNVIEQYMKNEKFKIHIGEV